MLRCFRRVTGTASTVLRPMTARGAAVRFRAGSTCAMRGAVMRSLVLVMRR